MSRPPQNAEYFLTESNHCPKRTRCCEDYLKIQVENVLTERRTSSYPTWDMGLKGKTNGKRCGWTPQGTDS